MATKSGWRLLTSSLKVRGSPTLLIKHETSVQNNGKVSRLKVCVTDLTYLWIETLERKELVRKACDTSIDPIEQFDTLLEYLNKGLNFAPKTSLSLKSERGRSHLVLHLRSPLPEPFRPLEWDFDLKQASELDFTSEFVVPLLGSLYETRNANSDLEAIISNKDKAIERIDTELKTHNKQITGLFDKRFYGENVAEKHKKGILMNKIPGFRPFDNEKWQSERNEQAMPDLKDLNKHLFEQGLQSKKIGSSLTQDAWWENLGSGVEVEEPSQISQPVVRHRQSTSDFDSSQISGATSTQHGYFANGIRSSPPAQDRPTSAAANHSPENDSDATASTMSDLESEAPEPTTRRIGKIGGRKPAQEDIADNRNGSEDTTNANHTEPSSRPAEISANASRPRGGIGRIGGAKVNQPRETEESARLSQSDKMPTRIPSAVADDQPPAATAHERNDGVPETAEERANRQRAMLKHDLEEKRKAPVKKKRKF